MLSMRVLTLTLCFFLCPKFSGANEPIDLRYVALKRTLHSELGLFIEDTLVTQGPPRFYRLAIDVEDDVEVLNLDVWADGVIERAFSAPIKELSSPDDDVNVIITVISPANGNRYIGNTLGRFLTSRRSLEISRAPNVDIFFNKYFFKIVTVRPGNIMRSRVRYVAARLSMADPDHKKAVMDARRIETTDKTVSLSDFFSGRYEIPCNSRLR